MTDSKVEYTVEEGQKIEYTTTTTTVEEKTSVIDEKASAREYLDTSSSSNEATEEFNARGDRIYVKSEAEKQYVRKLDFIYVMPFIAILNFLQFFDKSALNYAGALTLKEDTGITGTEFSWLGSLFYLGYLVYQVPNQYLLQRMPLAKYTGVLIIFWGLVLSITFEAKNFAQLAGLRFLLGFFEAAMYPCCIMLISAMYRRKEQAARLGVVYICNGVAMAVGGFIGYGIGHMEGVMGHASWQWLMIILGAVTMFFGIVIFVCLIDNPRSRFLKLTPEQSQIVDERQRDNTTVVTKEIKWSHITESLKEPRYYFFCIASMLINFQNGALNTFSAIITKGFGFTGVEAILLTVPSGVVDIIYIVIILWYNNKYGNTLYCAIVMLIFAIIGLVLLIAIPVPKAKLLGLYLCWAYAAAYVMFLSSLANNVNGYTKKLFYSSSVIVFYTIGNFVGPLMMVQSQAPLYIGGMIGYIAANVICIIVFWLARRNMDSINKERLARGITNVRDGEQMEDLTDKENPNFIYRL